MSEAARMLKEFHTTYQVKGDRTTPGFPSPDIEKLRYDLIEEELTELKDASEAHDIVEVADALADLIYVVYGAARSYGIPLDYVLAEVHRSNLSKLGADGKPIFREDGKVIKGPGYFKPDVANCLEIYGWDPEAEA